MSANKLCREDVKLRRFTGRTRRSHRSRFSQMGRSFNLTFHFGTSTAYLYHSSIYDPLRPRHYTHHPAFHMHPSFQPFLDHNYFLPMSYYRQDPWILACWTKHVGHFQGSDSLRPMGVKMLMKETKFLGRTQVHHQID